MTTAKKSLFVGEETLKERNVMRTAPSIGWIGIGKMGSPMSRHVLRAGFPVSVMDPLAENRATIVAEGASVAYSIEELTDKCDVVILTIPDDRALGQIATGEDGLARHLRGGQTLIEMSTVSPLISAELAKSLDEGVHYLRAPVSGSTATAVAAKLSILVSGPQKAFLACEPILTSFSTRRFYVGSGEEARYLKLVLNAMVGATSALLAEALSLGRRGNLSLADMLEVICESAVASPLIAYKRDLLLSENYEAAFSVSQMMKDFDLILDAAKTDHVPMHLTALIRQQYEAAFTAGQAEKDFFVLVEQHRRLAGAATGQRPETGAAKRKTRAPRR
jgi:3-hydroxyisobutyrate dehydrogenase-like beta-hydroxyacid dehydrogenase